MNRRQMLMNEIRAVLQPQDGYCILHRATNEWFRFEDYDISVCQPRPGAKGRRMDKSGQIFRIGGCDIYF